MAWSICINNIAKSNNRLDDECMTLIGKKMDEMNQNAASIQSEFYRKIKLKFGGDDECLDALIEENKCLNKKLNEKYAKIIRKSIECKKEVSHFLYEQMKNFAKNKNVWNATSNNNIKEEKNELDIDNSIDKVIKIEHIEFECDEETEDDDQNFETYTAAINLFCPHSDSDCEDVFTCHASFKMHMSKDHGDNKPYECNQCDRCYGTKGNLMVHIEKNHQKKINYKCDECGKGFYNKTEWSEHCRAHKGIMYECDECDLSFERKGHLRKHVGSVHNKEINHRCDVCNKGFYYKKDLTRHYRTHTGEKPFECKECERAFAQKGDLKKHQQTHSGERPFKCKKCHKGFIRKDRRNKHQNKCNRLAG